MSSLAIGGHTTDDVSSYQCDVCLTLSDDYLLLPDCGHSCCRPCLTQMVKAKRTNCPYCRVSFRPRSSPYKSKVTDKTVIIRGANHRSYVFVRNLKLNEVVKNLNIKCDFEVNGCQEVFKFESLSSHVMQCRFRICSACGLTVGGPTEHNCRQRLTWKLNRLRSDLKKSTGGGVQEEDRLKSITDDYEQQIRDLAQKLSTICSETDKFFRYAKHVMIGTYESTTDGIEVTELGIRLKLVLANTEVNQWYHIFIPYREIQKIMCTKGLTNPTILLKPDATSGQKIAECPGIGHEFGFDAQDKRRRYIIVSVYDLDFDNMLQFMRESAKLQNPNLIFKTYIKTSLLVKDQELGNSDV